MEFGKIHANELDKVDFSLAEEPAFNKESLVKDVNQKPKVYIGCAKWGIGDWVGKIFPRNTKEKDFLQHYASHYNAVELNATHYKIFGERAIGKWAEKTEGKDFIYCPKMYKGITHFRNLKGKEFLTNEFLRGVVAFEKQLGPIFIQLSDSFSPNRKEELFTFLSSLPKDLQFFLEVRHAGWFAKEKERDVLFSFLREHKIGAVITDTAGRRDCAHMHLTVPKAFIRYVGNSLHPTDYSRINTWIQRMKSWLQSGLKELYFFMHMHDELTSPQLTVYLVDKMNKECGLNLVKPKFIDTSQQPWVAQSKLFD